MVPISNSNGCRRNYGPVSLSQFKASGGNSQRTAFTNRETAHTVRERLASTCGSLNRREESPQGKVLNLIPTRFFLTSFMPGLILAPLAGVGRLVVASFHQNSFAHASKRF